MSLTSARSLHAHTLNPESTLTLQDPELEEGADEGGLAIQWYLAHKKQPPSLGLP